MYIFFPYRFPWVKENSLGFSSDMPSTCTRSLIQNFYFLCSIITIMAWPSSLLGTMWSGDDGLDLVHLKGHRSHLRLYGPPWLLRVHSSSTSPVTTVISTSSAPLSTSKSTSSIKTYSSPLTHSIHFRLLWVVKEEMYREVTVDS